jgi:phenylalanyl-tRNA synthetase alpha chain
MTTDPPTAMERSLSMLRATFRQRFEAAATEQALRDENAKILGPKGELTVMNKHLKEVAPEARKAIGELLNALRHDVKTAFDERLGAIERARRDEELNAPPFD